MGERTYAGYLASSVPTELRGQLVGISCSFNSLAILLRNEFESNVYRVGTGRDADPRRWDSSGAVAYQCLLCRQKIATAGDPSTLKSISYPRRAFLVEKITV